MELKAVICLFKKNIKLIIAVTIICILFFMIVGEGMEILNSGFGQGEAKAKTLDFEIVPFEANLFTAASYVSFKIDNSDLPFSLNNDAEALLEHKYIKTTGAITAYLQTNSFYISILERYEDDMSLSRLRRHISAYIFPNSTYIYFAANGLTSDKAVFLANLAADVAIDTLQNAVDDIYDIKLIGKAINEYNEEDIELLLEMQKEIIEEFNFSEQSVEVSRFNMRRMPVFLILGFAFGLVIAICIAFLKEYMSPYFADSSRATEILDVGVFAECNQPSFKKITEYKLKEMKASGIDILTVVSMGKQIIADEIPEKIASCGDGLKILIISNRAVNIDPAKNVKAVTVSDDKRKEYIRGIKESNDYDMIIVDGGSLYRDSSAWEMLNSSCAVLGIIHKNKTMVETAQNVVKQLDNINCKLSGIIWIDSNKKAEKK